MEKMMTTEWQPGNNLLITKLSGLLNAADIQKWEQSLVQASAAINDNSTFKMLVDLYGFKAENMDVHKQFRTIIPLFLAQYHYRIGFLDMFPEATVTLTATRGIRCVAMGNVHQDESKMKDYQQKFSKPYEQYFTDSEAALQWILSI